MATYPVKYLHSGMRGAPVLTGQAGTLVALLHAALVTGFGMVTALSASVAAGTATVQFNAGQSFDVGDIVVVLHNLLENALRHGEGRAIEVVLEGRQLAVCDRGPGFGSEDPMRSFERFRRGGGKPGHGLGLALVQHICTACGWTVRAANRPDGGACLTIDFEPAAA